MTSGIVEDVLKSLPEGEVLAPSGPVRHRAAATPAARAAISVIWTTEVPSTARATRVLPDAAVDLVLSGGRIRVAGPDTRPCIERLPPGRVVGVQLRPDAVSTVLGLPASELRDSRPEIDELWGAAGRDLTEAVAAAGTLASAVAIIEAAVRARMATGPRSEAAGGLRQQVAQHGRACAREIGLSERQLRRRCVSAYGYGPRTLARIVRFQDALDRLRAGRVPLAEVAVRSGYVDQAHLAHDAGEFSGLTPAALRAALTVPGGG